MFRFLDVPIGPGDILMGVLDLSFYNFSDPDLPAGEGVMGVWDLLALQLRNLGGTATFQGTTSVSVDPLVLDLDGDGIELEWRTGTSVGFDIDNDLYREPIAYVGADDGYLARDINGNGTIDDGNELFGHDEVLGFDVLATLDGNNDGMVSTADNGLADFNGDGVVDAGDRFEDLLVWQDLKNRMAAQDYLQAA